MAYRGGKMAEEEYQGRNLKILLLPVVVFKMKNADNFQRV